MVNNLLIFESLFSFFKVDFFLDVVRKVYEEGKLIN